MADPRLAEQLVAFFERNGSAVDLTVSFYEEHVLQLRLSPGLCVAMMCSADGRDVAWLDGTNWTRPHSLRIEEIASLDSDSASAFGSSGSPGASLLLQLDALRDPARLRIANELRERAETLATNAAANGDSVPPILRGLRDGLLAASQQPEERMATERACAVTSVCRFVPGAEAGIMRCVGALAVAADSDEWFFADLPGCFREGPDFGPYMAHGVASGWSSVATLEDFVDRANGITISCSVPEVVMAPTARAAAFRHLFKYFADTLGLPRRP